MIHADSDQNKLTKQEESNQNFETWQITQ